MSKTIFIPIKLPCHGERVNALTRLVAEEVERPFGLKCSRDRLDGVESDVVRCVARDRKGEYGDCLLMMIRPLLSPSWNFFSMSKTISSRGI